MQAAICKQYAGTAIVSWPNPERFASDMPARSWKFHTGRWLLSACLILLAGWLAGFPIAAAAASLFAYTAWHAVNAWRLHIWQGKADGETPKSIGIWAEAFEHIQSMKQQNHRQQQEHISQIGGYKNLTNAFPDASLVIDENNRITWFNHAAEDLLSLKNPADLDQPVTNLLRGPDIAEWLASGDKPGKSLQIPSPANDNVWLEISMVTLRQDQVLIVLRDITDVHNLDQIRRDFVANISHELRTPLTVIKGYLELLQNHKSLDVSKAVSRMQDQEVQIQLLLDDLLELSRLQSDEIHAEDESVNIAMLLEQLKEQAEELSLGRHDLVFDVDASLRLCGQKSDLESAFRNLLTNAVKYTPDGGKITVDWHDSPAGPRLIIRDTGNGIPKRDISRLTERFYRVGSDRARQTGGSGLGLSIVKHVLNAHDAGLSIVSELGEGSEFTCTFPPDRKIFEKSQE